MFEYHVWVVTRETWMEDDAVGRTVEREVIGVRATLAEAKEMAYADQLKLLGRTSWKGDWYDGANYSHRDGDSWWPSYNVERFEVPI